MNRWYLVVIVVVMTFAQNLAAQTVVRPAPVLDAGRVTVRDALLSFRDSLNSIDAAASRLQRDYRQASTAALLSRARVMREACARSVRGLPAARDAVLTADASEGQRARRQAELVKALDRLKKPLVRCESDFAAMSQKGEGEKVRGYANERARQVLAAMRQYEHVLGTFFGAMGIRVPSLGGRAHPLAG